MTKRTPSTSSLISRLRPSPEENDFYIKLFASLDPQGTGIVYGSAAGALFRTSGLPDELLFGIWGVGDSADSGELDFAAFLICCRLIAYAQAHGINCIAPGGDFSAANIERTKLYYKDPKVLPKFNRIPQDEYSLQTADYENYQRLFLRLDVDGDGFIEGEDARSFYLDYTDLTVDELMQLWTLADVTYDGRLSLEEFCIMQQLVKVASRRQGPIPQELPSSLAALVGPGNGAVPAGANVSAVGPYPSDAGAPAGNSNVGGLDSAVTPRLHENAAQVQAQANEGSLLSGPQVDLLKMAESLIARLKAAIEMQREKNASHNSEKTEMEVKLQQESDALDLLASEYRALRGDGESIALETEILKEKLHLIEKQAQDMRADIAQLKAQNAALAAAHDKNEENLGRLSSARSQLIKQAQDDLALLRMEERQLNVLRNTLDQLRREKQRLQAQSNNLRERLDQSESATKTMMRAIEKEQGSIASIRSERINTLQQRISLESVARDDDDVGGAEQSQQQQLLHQHQHQHRSVDDIIGSSSGLLGKAQQHTSAGLLSSSASAAASVASASSLLNNASHKVYNDAKGIRVARAPSYPTAPAQVRRNTPIREGHTFPE